MPNQIALGKVMYASAFRCASRCHAGPGTAIRPIVWAFLQVSERGGSNGNAHLTVFPSPHSDALAASAGSFVLALSGASRVQRQEAGRAPCRGQIVATTFESGCR